MKGNTMFVYVLTNILLPSLEVVVPIAFFFWKVSGAKAEKKSIGQILLLTLLIALFGAAVSGIRVIGTGNFGVTSIFGYVPFDQKVLEPGLRWVPPWVQVHDYSSRKETVHATMRSKDGTVVNLRTIASDGLLLEVDADLSIVTNPKYLPRVYAAFGTMDNLLRTLLIGASHNAIKNAGNLTKGKDAWETKRADFEKLIHDQFVEVVVGQIRPLPEFAELTDKELHEVFIFPPALLGPTLPPVPVTDQVALLRASDEAKNTEASLAELAKAKQITATEESKVIGEYVKGLPPGVSLDEVSRFMDAQTFRTMMTNKYPIGSLQVSVGSANTGMNQIPVAPATGKGEK